MMEAIQLDLFDFVAMQTAVQSKVQEVPETIVPRNFQNDGRQGMPTTPAARIEVNFKAIRLLKKLKAEKRVPSVGRHERSARRRREEQRVFFVPPYRQGLC